MKLLLLVFLLTRESSFCANEELNPYSYDVYDAAAYPVLKPREAGQWLISGSGSGLESGSGSGDPLLPVTATAPAGTTATVVPEYGTVFFITFTFHNLTEQLYYSKNIAEKLTDLLTRLLRLDATPLVLFDVQTASVIVYFPIESSSAAILEGYEEILATTNDSDWKSFVQENDLLDVKVTEVGMPMPWWHWLTIALSASLALSSYCLIFLICCCRQWAINKRKHPSKISHEDQNMQYEYSKVFQMKEHARQQLVRKVSRVNYQSKSHTHFYSHPLSVVDLEQAILNQSSLVAEYAKVPSNMVSMAEVPAGAEDKNRYKDVLPNPQTRVALFLKFGVANSDYINANYIRGYQSLSKAYIATQGPLLWTVADFWRMIKSVQYWPEEKHSHSVSYEDLQIHLRRRIITKNYSTTTLLLQHRNKMVCREVTHFWFTGWPDHGVPSSARSLVDFLLHVRQHKTSDMPGPIVVHCSAGIGRTGVLIAADIAMQQLDKEGEVDILRILSTLRQDRGGMIQTKDQYVFLHQVLLEYAKYQLCGRGTATQQRLETTAEEEEPLENDTVELLS